MKATKLGVSNLIFLLLLLLGYAAGEAQEKYSIKGFDVKNISPVVLKPDLFIPDILSLELIPELKINEETKGETDKDYGNYSTKLYYVDMSVGNPCYVDKKKHVYIHIRPQHNIYYPIDAKYDLYFWQDKNHIYNGGESTMITVSGKTRFYVLVKDTTRANNNNYHRKAPFILSVEYDPTEPNDSIESATRISCLDPGESDVINGRTDSFDDEDFYRVDIDEPCMIALSHSSDVDIYSISVNGEQEYYSRRSNLPDNIEVIWTGKKGKLVFGVRKKTKDYSNSFDNKYEVTVTRLPGAVDWFYLEAMKDENGKYTPEVKNITNSSSTFSYTVFSYTTDCDYLGMYFNKIDLESGDHVEVEIDDKLVKIIKGKQSNVWVYRPTFREKSEVIKTKVAVKFFNNSRNSHGFDLAYALLGYADLHFYAKNLPLSINTEKNLGIPEISKKKENLSNIPNPFNPETDIAYVVPENGNVVLSVLNTKGKKVIELVNGNKAAGSHSVHWNGKDSRGKDMPSGVYYAVLEVNGKRFTKKMVMLK